MKKKIIILVFIVVILVVFLVFKLFNKEVNISNARDIDTYLDLDDGDLDIDWSSLESYNLKLDKSVTIDKEGIYTLTGKILDGNILVNTEGDVKLILDNVSITNSKGPAIIVEQANNTVIELRENTTNYLIDGTNFENQEYDGCLYSKDDLVIEGLGTLNLKSNYLDGIVSNDDLKIINGNFIIDSKGDGIRGKDSVYILDGNFKINSGVDAIKATNDIDNEKGYINILNGNFKIESKEDGLQAETKLIIENGVFDIKTGDGSGSLNSAIHDYFYNGTYDKTSSKALKAVDNLVIKNGKFNIDSQDDAIHSNNYVGIINGNIEISSGDDGIHADLEIIIDNGVISINKSYEGIEASDVTINGGDISVTTNDDGINVSGGKDLSSVGGRPGENMMTQNIGTLTINDGKIYVNSIGDGLDANGNIVMNGGEVNIDGPTNSGNASLDYDTTFDLNGGTFIAVGSSGMAQTASNSSSQYSLAFYLSNNYTGKIELIDENNNTVISYSPKKSYQFVTISTNNIKKDTTYTLKIDGEEITNLTSTDIVTSNGFSRGMVPVPNLGGGHGRKKYN